MQDGLYSGDYYAGLVIPADFSDSLLGFTDGEFETPEIIYYDNQKMNAVASRVTDRAQSIVKNEVNSIFLASIVDELSNFTSVFSGIGSDASLSLDGLDEQLEDIKTDLRTYVSIMDSMAAVTQSALNVTTMTSNLLPDVEINPRFYRGKKNSFSMSKTAYCGIPVKVWRPHYQSNRSFYAD